ncbi:MAG: GNAT family N-acetyltransferase [Halalkalicoccus sp.]
MEYRPIPDDRSEEFHRFVSYAFSPESGPELDDPPESYPGERYGLFDGDELLCVCRHYFLDARVRGEDRAVAGLSAVASPPEHRRRGHVARLLEATLADYRERGIDVSVLWPFEHAFYAKYGWARTNDYAHYETRPETLAPAAGPDRGEFRRVEADGWASLDSVHRAHGERADLSLRRPETWWRRRIFERWTDGPYVYRWDDDGEPRAYLAYVVDSDADERTLRITDMAYREFAGFRQLLRFLANHGSQIDRVTFRAPPDCLLFGLVDAPHEVECTLHAGPMSRIIDVQRALAGLPAPDGRLTIAVSDPLAPWNDRTVALSPAGCEPTDEEPTVEVGIGTLSRLFVGARSVETLERVGECSIRDERARTALESLFPARRVYLGEHF